ncbi:hypothetical protein ACFLVP_01005 [Chloroflexota bacterium]
MEGLSTGWMSMAAAYDAEFIEEFITEWGAQDQLVQQLETMSYAEVRHSGSETIQGTDCYVFSINLDMDELIDIVLQQPGMEDSLQGMPPSELRDIVQDIIITEWISKDTGLLMKTESDMHMKMDGDSMDMNMSMRFYDHNIPLNITLPNDCPTWPPPMDEVLANLN